MAVRERRKPAFRNNRWRKPGRVLRATRKNQTTNPDIRLKRTLACLIGIQVGIVRMAALLRALRLGFSPATAGIQ